MAYSVVTCNYLLFQCAQVLRGILDAGAACRLFSNDITPGPGFATLQFAESTFPGYARWNMNGVWSDPLKVADGDYLVSTVSHTFSCTGASNNVVYGWYIVQDNKVLAAGRFLAPYTMGPGTNINLAIAIEDFFSP